MGLGTQAGLPLGLVFTSSFCIFLPQAPSGFLQTQERPTPPLQTAFLWIYSESQTPSSGLEFFVCLEVCCIPRSESSG